MAGQYVSQQWRELPSGVAGRVGPNSASLERTQEDNPEFIYPGRYRRDLGGGNPQIIQRGFMRSLLGSVPLDGGGGTVGDALGNSRFFFQFNPQQIQRSVAVSGGLMNPLLQDPGQFSVATPGNATFSFDIFLNREAEVNAGTNTLAPPTFGEELLNGLPGAQGQSQGVIATDYKPRIEQDPGRYGVLSDLQVLDNIIGQGITEKTITALSKIQSVSSSWDTSETSAGASVTGAAENAKTAAEVNDALRNIQFGNSAFLISTPVRIVFSSMFMIDGFIQGSNVLFSKFSGDMIPTVCAINITVEAKYIGFAKEKTYLTDSLSRAIENPNKDGTTIAEPTVGDRAEYDLLRGWLSSLPDYQIALVGMDDSDTAGWGELTDSVAINRVLSFDDVRCQFGFRDNTTDDSVGSSNLAKAFYEGKYAIYIEHIPEVYVWRKFKTTAEQAQATTSGITLSNQPVGPGVGQWDGFSALTSSSASRFRGSRDVLLLAINCQVASASTYDTWRTFHAYGGFNGINDGGAFAKTKTDFAPQGKQANTVFSNSGKSKDEAKRAYLQESDWTEAKDFDFIVDIKLKIKATITSLENIGKPSEISFEIYKTVVQNAAEQVGQLINITTKDVPAG